MVSALLACALTVACGRTAEPAYACPFLTADCATLLAVQAEVKRLSLYHHDPLQTDVLVDQKVEEARARAIHHGETRLEVSGARERVQLRLR